MRSYARRPAISDEALNAYVDGAVTSAEAAFIARHAAQSPEIAQRIAVLHQLKAGVAGIADDLVVIEPHMPAMAVRHRRFPRWGSGALAAAAVIVVSLSLLWLTDVAEEPVVAAANVPLAGFVLMHDSWTRAEDLAANERPMPGWLESPMQATGLGLAYQALLPTGEGASGQHFAFVGPKGCRLSLFEISSPVDGTAALDLSLSHGLLTAHWLAEEYGYVLVARNMDRSRFVRIAASLHDSSHDRGAVDAELLAGLEQARQPCVS